MTVGRPRAGGATVRSLAPRQQRNERRAGVHRGFSPGSVAARSCRPPALRGGPQLRSSRPAPASICTGRRSNAPRRRRADGLDRHAAAGRGRTVPPSRRTGSRSPRRPSYGIEVRPRSPVPVPSADSRRKTEPETRRAWSRAPSKQDPTSLAPTRWRVGARCEPRPAGRPAAEGRVASSAVRTRSKGIGAAGRPCRADTRRTVRGRSGLRRRQSPEPDATTGTRHLHRPHAVPMR